MHHRARKLATPAYVNTDAAFRDGWAGVAYASRALGERIAVVATTDSTEAEFWAMVMAMYDADRCLSCWPAIVFRTDCASVAQFVVVKQASLKPMRAEIVEMVRIHRQWSVELVKRSWNKRANKLARDALDETGTGADARREALLGRHA
jgi:Reverse transcriptase-like